MILAAYLALPEIGFALVELVPQTQAVVAHGSAFQAVNELVVAASTLDIDLFFGYVFHAHIGQNESEVRFIAAQLGVVLVGNRLLVSFGNGILRVIHFLVTAIEEVSLPLLVLLGLQDDGLLGEFVPVLDSLSIDCGV